MKMTCLKLVVYIWVLIQETESSIENTVTNKNLESETKLRDLSNDILRKVENIEAEQKSMFGAINLMKDEFQPLIYLPNAMEKYLEDYDDTTENNSTTLNPGPQFPLLRNLFRNAFRKFEVGLMLHRIKSCYTLRHEKNYRTSGVYDIFPFNDKQSYKTSMKAYCDMDSYGGGWTVFQRRGIPGELTEIDRSDLFNKTWSAYSNGFGDPHSDYWLGLTAIHSLTKECTHEILITATALDGTSYQGRYAIFRVASEDSKFKLTVTDYITENSTLENRFDYVNDISFSTIDRDNDYKDSGSCSQVFGMNGFWLKSCAYVSLNGMYPSETHPNTMSETADQQGMTWYHSGAWMKLKSTEMKIRPNC